MKGVGIVLLVALSLIVSVGGALEGYTRIMWCKSRWRARKRKEVNKNT